MITFRLKTRNICGTGCSPVNLDQGCLRPSINFFFIWSLRLVINVTTVQGFIIKSFFAKYPGMCNDSLQCFHDASVVGFTPNVPRLKWFTLLVINLQGAACDGSLFTPPNHLQAIEFDIQCEEHLNLLARAFSAQIRSLG